ncbi:ABC transporter substrate-binding protein [Kineococcus rhizosphaerae]|uniref:Carbohydrate ABC transporter substrate-binding protein (CUT1 family) n=1 Tax=Kineococcus rhizosphaerae TaxID=559628 RepID=A0A2T0R3H6_9ACTN|nr:extracellular solute-binding protein [Kineococcus rhizosphaerae]PRY14602.1 carbohydrate ABC transporter substrate-binding protein (CUT1 family) [Kineococcus rhizosphaerae]
MTDAPRTHRSSFPHGLSRRSVVAAFAATGSVAALAACAPGSSGGSKASGDSGGTLRVSTWGNDSRLKLTQQAAAEFEKANPGIKVTVENSEWTNYWDKLATSTAANDSPDVIQMDEAYIAAYGTRGALLDLDTVKSQLDLSEMDSKVLDTGKVEDKLVGAPIGVGNFSVGVNPTVLQQAGVEMPDDTKWTWEEFAALATQVSAKLGAQGVVGFDGYGTGTAEVGAWVRQFKQEIFPTKEQTAADEATVTSYFEYADALVASGATPQASVQSENSTAALDASLFATNKAAFHLQFHTQISAFAAASGNELKLLRLPAQKTGESPRMVNKASMYWSISARTKQSENAAKFVDFMLTDPAATKILTTERGVPAIPSVQKDIEPVLSPQSKIVLAFSQAIASEVVDPPQVTPSGASAWNTEFTTIGTDQLFGRTKPADAAKNALTTAKGMV